MPGGCKFLPTAFSPSSGSGGLSPRGAVNCGTLTLLKPRCPSESTALNDNKPVVFISSTIYDFRDLRSALKFWLEEFGYEVMASEWNDFPQIPRQKLFRVLPSRHRLGGLLHPVDRRSPWRLVRRS